MVDRSVALHEAEIEADLRGEAVLRVEIHAQLAQRMFDHVDTIHGLSAEAFRSSAPEHAGRLAFIQQQLRSLTAEERGGVFQVATIDADGRLRWSSVGAMTGVDLSDREHFRAHVEGQRTAFVSAPLIGRASGRQSIQLTRPILDEAGTLVGISVVSVDPNIISNDLGLVATRDRGRILLVRSDGLILATNNTRDGWAGQRLGNSNLQRILTDMTGVAFMMGSRTGERRIAAWKQIGAWPVFVVHSLPRDIARVTAQARGQTEWRLKLSSILAFWGITVAAVMWYRVRLARQATQYAELARAETAQTLAALPGAAYRVDYSIDGSVDWRPAARAASTILGSSQDAGECGDAFETMTDIEGNASRVEFLRRLVRDGEAVAEYSATVPGVGMKRIREHARVLESGFGRNTMIVGMLTDITAQRHLEAQVLRSARLANLGDMASGMAHEVNQPATAIALAADLALIQMDRVSSDPSLPLRESLEAIAQQAIRLRSVISHFRAFSRPDQDSGPLNFESLQTAVEGARRIFDGILNAAGVTLRVCLPHDLPRIQCRLVPLEQVLVNLVINCRDAILSNPQASRIIDISAQVDMENSLVTVLLQDYAGGFAPDILPHVLDPFFTTKGPENGTGLGLSIAHTTMKSFFGDIRVRNHFKGGAEVSLIFKCCIGNKIPNLENIHG